MLVPSVDFNPRTYKQSHTPTVVQGGAWMEPLPGSTESRIRSFPRAFLLCVNVALSWLNLPIYPPERNTKAVVESCSFSRAATVYGGS